MINIVFGERREIEVRQFNNLTSFSLPQRQRENSDKGLGMQEDCQSTVGHRRRQNIQSLGSFAKSPTENKMVQQARQFHGVLAS